MKLNSIVLGIIILIAFCYLYSRGFKEGQQNPSNVFVKAKVGAKVSGAGMAAYNGDYAIGIGGGEIATRCKKGKREKFCDLKGNSNPKIGYDLIFTCEKTQPSKTVVKPS